MPEQRKNSKPSEISQDNRVVSILSAGHGMPHNEQAEIAVLGAMLQSSDAVASAISGLKVPHPFFREAHQLIYDTMEALASGSGDAAIDPVIVINNLEQKGALETAGGREYIFELMDSVPTVANIAHYVDIVKQNAILRQIISACGDTITQCYEYAGDAQEMLDMVGQRIFDLASLNETQEMLEIKRLVSEGMGYIQDLYHHREGVTGIPTGFYIDRRITGLKPGELIVIAARPSVGKTALALNIATNIALRGGGKGIPVGFFSLEMPALQLVIRMLCSEARVSVRDIQRQMISNREINSISEVAKILGNSNIVIDDTGAPDILELRAKARKMRKKYNVGAIFIDYLQLIRAHNMKSNSSRENEVAMISGSLKAMAKELNIPVVVLSQLNRQAEGDSSPKLSTLRESGAIEQDADVVILLHRERKDQLNQAEDDKAGLETEVIVAKNRNGGIGTEKLLFLPQITRFENAALTDDRDSQGLG